MSSPRDKMPRPNEPASWPAKDIIMNHLMQFIPSASATMPAVSKQWHQDWMSYMHNRGFWLHVLKRDFHFQEAHLTPLKDLDLKILYMRMARLEETNPTYAHWFQQNIIATGCDFSVLYAGHKKIDALENAKRLFTPAWNHAYHDIKTVLCVNNLVLAKMMLDQLQLAANSIFLQNLQCSMTDFGNYDAYVWLMKYIATIPAITRDVPTVTAAEEKVASIPLLEFALKSSSRRFIDAACKLTSPEEALGLCTAITNSAKHTPWPGLTRHAIGVVKILIPLALQAIPTATPLEHMRQRFYPLAAFSGDIATFRWLDETLQKQHQPDPDFIPEPPADNTVLTLCIAMRAGKIDLLTWLISPDGGKLDAKRLTPNEVTPALQSGQPDIVVWLLETLQMLSMAKQIRMLSLFCEYPGMTPLLSTLIDKTYERRLLIGLLYTAAVYGNTRAVEWLIDKVVLTADEKITLTKKALDSLSVPLFESLTSPERKQNRITLTDDILTQAIRQTARDHHPVTNDLPALIHWLIDPGHGNLSVTAAHREFIDDTLGKVRGCDLIAQKLVKQITAEKTPPALKPR